MSLYIADNKVRFKSDDAIWYECGFEIVNGRVNHTRMVEAADPGVGFDEYAVLTCGVGVNATRHKVFAFTHEGLAYLDVEQEETEEADNGPVLLVVGGVDYVVSYALAVSAGSDDRKYLDYVLDQPEYVAGVITNKLTAKFKSGSKTLNMRLGDDVRDIIIMLSENNRALPSQPEWALMKITTPDGVIVGRELTSKGSGDWAYRVSDADFDTDLVVGAYTIEVYGRWADGTHGTFPTNGTLTLNVLSKMTTLED